ncbi:MAG: isopenicillin N synthase family oxygenase [Acaryochloris sp. RU_4_1]|nr:isopenicillin N synthase family oxygenase [Acaryochloris sp. RU_4_1]NJR53607.1 isopenicillin N synthase family oxygenase [Acaryochloris sp. CRU_2_0]
MIQPLPTIDYRASHAPQAFAQSLQDVGFAILSHSPISREWVQRTYAEWQSFFQSEEKAQYTFDPKVQSGYFPLQTEEAKGHTTPDLKEFFHVYVGHPLPEGMSEATWQLFAQLQELATELLDWVEQQAPPDIRATFTQPLSTMIANSQETLLRLLHYPPLPSVFPLGAVRAAAHEDINLITLLPAATAVGLELLDREGQWRPVSCDRTDMVINVGDMLQLASQGHYRSTTHRVINPPRAAGQQSRLSMPFFLHPRPEVVLAAGKTAHQYLQERLQEIGLV